MKGKSCWLVMGEQLFYLSFDEFREWGVVGAALERCTDVILFPRWRRSCNLMMLLKGCKPNASPGEQP